MDMSKKVVKEAVNGKCGDKLKIKRLIMPHLKRAMLRELKWKPLNPQAIKNILASLNVKKRPNKDSLDKISLLAGFQDWNSFCDALKGKTDAESNFTAYRKGKAKRRP